MVSQKFVNAFFPGCDFGFSISARVFVVEQTVRVGKTQDNSCANCGAEYLPEVKRDSTNAPYTGECASGCSAVVEEYMYAVVTLSKKGRILPYRWIKDIALDF